MNRPGKRTGSCRCGDLGDPPVVLGLSQMMRGTSRSTVLLQPAAIAFRRGDNIRYVWLYCHVRKIQRVCIGEDEKACLTRYSLASARET